MLTFEERVVWKLGAGAKFAHTNMISHTVLIKWFRSQLPHKIVNLLFTITYNNNNLTILWGS